MIQRIKNWCIESLGGYTEELYFRRLDGLELRANALEIELDKEKARRHRESKTFRTEATLVPFCGNMPIEELERDMTAKLMEAIKPFVRWSSRDGVYFGSVIKVAEITVVTGGNHE